MRQLFPFTETVNMMGKSAAQLDLVFSALSDPTRRAVLARLRQGEASLTRLAKPLQVSLPSMSKHVRVLERAGLVDRQVAGWLHRGRRPGRPADRRWFSNPDPARRGERLFGVWHLSRGARPGAPRLHLGLAGDADGWDRDPGHRRFPGGGSGYRGPPDT